MGTNRRPEFFMALSAAKLDGRTNFDVASDAGLAPSLLSYILNRRVEPSPEQAAALGRALGEEPARLFPSLNDEAPAEQSERFANSGRQARPRGG